MKNHECIFSVDKMAKTLGVSRSGYYKYKDRLPSTRQLYNHKVTQLIRTIFVNSRSIYGRPRIHAGLIAQGIFCSRQKGFVAQTLNEFIIVVRCERLKQL